MLAEFGLVLYLLFLVVLLPVLDLGSLIVAAATQYLATNDFAAKAATQGSFSSCLNQMAIEAYSFQSTGLAKFANMIPDGGYTGCGDDLYVMSTSISSGAVTVSGANQPPSSQIDTTNNMYELSVKSVYKVAPLISLAGVPLLSEIPGLGQPVELTFSASRPVEHPGGLQTAGNNSTAAGITPFPRVIASSSPGAPAPPIPGATWRTPNIYNIIAAAGQTVVSQAIIEVPAMQPTLGALTATGLTITAGQKIYIDTQAQGTWETAPTFGNTDANGYPGQSFDDQVSNTLTYGALLGVVSSSPPFLLGNDTYNLPPPTTGPVYLLMNQCEQQYPNGIGYQTVRVIIVQ